MKKVLFVFGTRPEAIKMAPIILEAKKQKLPFKVCVTAQHRELLDQVLELFQILPDYDLNLMSHNQGLLGISSLILTQLEQVLDDYSPNLVLVHGDTTTTCVVALASYYKKISVGHVEAGLRTGDIYSPWPEEGNRKIVSAIAALHFAPTNASSNNLLSEGISSKRICITGNTVIDALLQATKILDQKTIPESDNYNLSQDEKLIVVTCHRRENFGQGINNICESIKYLAHSIPYLKFVVSVHPNPNISTVVESKLSGYNNIILHKPFDYLEFISILKQSFIILTDSGGIQEEAPSLGKPVLLLRDKTERPEAIQSGNVIMVGADFEKITNEVKQLVGNDEYYNSFSQKQNPYGDGKASERIIKRILMYFNEN